jgi:uncharacterized protein (TIGR02246 family)
MSSDEHEIRQLVTTWMRATRAGDVDTVLDLMTDDAVFLVPGRPPMRKADYAQAAKAQAAHPAPKFDGTSEIQEFQVLGDWAYLWTKLRVVATPADGSAPTVRSGHTLTLLRKVAADGGWRATRTCWRRSSPP